MNLIVNKIETSEQKSSVFVTRFESSSDGIKSTTSKIADVGGVLIEEVLSEPEQEKDSPQGDVVIEEITEYEGKCLIRKFEFHAKPNWDANSCYNNINNFEPQNGRECTSHTRRKHCSKSLLLFFCSVTRTATSTLHIVIFILCHKNEMLQKIHNFA